MHPDFDTVSWQNDVMLLKLYGPVPDWIPKIRLNNDPAVPADGSEVTVIGMGRLDEDGELGFPNVLQEVKVNVLDYDRCNSDDMYKGFIDDATMICAAVENGGQDACKSANGTIDALAVIFLNPFLFLIKQFLLTVTGYGDSGGPLLQESSDGTLTQIGIVSFGVGCARATKPGAYTRISTMYEFIQETICEYSSTPPATCSNTRHGDLQTTTEAPSSEPSPSPTPAPSPTLRTRDFTKTGAQRLPFPDSVP